MTRARGIATGSIAGLVLGGALIGYAHWSARLALRCPADWTATSAPALANAELLVACTRARSGGPMMALYRTNAAASTAMNPLLAESVRAIAGPNPAPTDAPDTGTLSNDALITAEQSLDRGTAPLIADVYLVAAGHRFGLLNIVYAPQSLFADAMHTARWLSTIGGTSPWGTPDGGAITASCPEGFVVQPATTPRTVVRCEFGLGSSAFTLLSLTWDVGGLDSDEDRTRVATAISSRLAQAQGPTARIVAGPEPFTLARNVDAMHTRVETGESVPVSVHVVAVRAARGAPDVLGIAHGDSSTELAAGMTSLFATTGAMRTPSVLRGLGAIVCALALVLAGAIAGAWLGRRRA